MERLDLAQAEYARGLSKLQGTAAELRSLSGRAGSTEKKAKRLMEDLRELRSKQALQLRSDAAVKALAATKQHTAVQQLVEKLGREGF